MPRKHHHLRRAPTTPPKSEWITGAEIESKYGIPQADLLQLLQEHGFDHDHDWLIPRIGVRRTDLKQILEIWQDRTFWNRS